MSENKYYVKIDNHTTYNPYRESITIEELEPCPFCGGEAILAKDKIFCFDCWARLPFDKYYYAQPIELSCSERMENARKEAIEAWNRRAGVENDERKHNL